MLAGDAGGLTCVGRQAPCAGEFTRVAQRLPHDSVLPVRARFAPGSFLQDAANLVMPSQGSSLEGVTAGTRAGGRWLGTTAGHPGGWDGSWGAALVPGRCG